MSFRRQRVLAALLLTSAACSSSETATDPSDAGGNDGPSSDAPGIDAPPGCDLTKGPSESAACVDDSVGVFVSASGDDGATGNKATPVKTIGKALDLAAAHGLPRVYVCEGKYGDPAEITMPVAIFGGLSCAWVYTGVKPKLSPPKGIALRVTGVTGAVLVQDLEVDGAADTTAPGDSAIATFVANSPGVVFRNDTLTLLRGVDRRQRVHAVSAG